MIRISRNRRTRRKGMWAAGAVFTVVTLAAGISSAWAAIGPAQPAVAKSAQIASGSWMQVFRDDFSGASGTGLSTNNWIYDQGTSYPGGAANWGTGEVETSTNSTANVYQDGEGHLVIKPVRDASGNWTSGRVETKQTNFQAPVGGKLKLTASIMQPNPASGLGYWPAFWALGAPARPVNAKNWPGIGELDMMEDVNARSQVSHTFHCGVWGQPPCNEPTGIGSGLLGCSGCQTGYHTYSVIVDRTNANDEFLSFLTDNVSQFAVHEKTVGPTIWANAVDHGFFMILNVAIGGSYPDKVCNCKSAGGSLTSGGGMSVDYVAAYTQSKSGSTTQAGSAPTKSANGNANRNAGSAAQSGTIQAERLSKEYGTQTAAVTDTGGGSYVGRIGNGDWLQYDSVDFGATDATQFQARVASGAAAGVSGSLQVHLDSLTGPTVAQIDVANTGGWQSWRTVRANMAATRGRHTVYLRFVSGSTSDFMNMNWFMFGR